MPKIKLDSFVEYGSLFVIYGKLLSEDRQKICEEYFSFNMTIAEISQQRKISRQAVFDAIHKSCTKLEEFENLLKINRFKGEILKGLQEINLLAETENSTTKIKEKVEKMIKEI